MLVAIVIALTTPTEVTPGFGSVLKGGWGLAHPTTIKHRKKRIIDLTTQFLVTRCGSRIQKRLRQPHPLSSPYKITEHEAQRQKQKDCDGNHDDYKANQKQKDRRAEIDAFGNGVAQTSSEAGCIYCDLTRRFDVDSDRREAGAIFEKTFATLELLDVGSHIGDLTLHFQRVFNFPCLLHDVQELKFECLLSSDAGFEVDELFGDVISRDGLFAKRAGKVADLVEDWSKPVRRHAYDELDIEGAFCRIRVLALLGFRSDDESAVRFGD